MANSKILFIVFSLVWMQASAFQYKDSLIDVVNNNAVSNRENKANALLELSRFYWASLTDSALSMSQKVIEIGEELDNPKIIADGYFNIGMIEYVNGSFSNGYASFIKASEFYLEIKDQLSEANCLYHGGICLRNLGQINDAKNWVQKGFDIVSKTHNNQLAFSMSYELGELYALLNENDIADNYFNEAIKIAKFHGDSNAVVSSYIGLGCFYQDISELNKSLISFNNAFKHTHPSNKQVIAQLYNHIGETHLLNNKLQEAADNFNLALITAKEANSKLVQSRSHFNLSKIYEIQQKYALALIEYKLYSQINDSVNSVLKTQSISELQAKFDNVSLSKEMQLKDLEFEKSELAKKESEMQLKNQALQNKLIFGGLCLALLFGIGLGIAFRRQKKLNIKLDELGAVAKEIDNTVIIADKNGDVKWLNESYYRKYGLTLEGFKEKYGGNILKNFPTKKIEEKFEVAISQKKTVQYLLTNKDKDGNERHLRSTLTPTLNKDGEIEKFILIDTEITDLIEAEKKITKHRDKLHNVYTQISESIDYAQRIQDAILPHSDLISKHFKESYLLYAPKDVVSGDFYFIQETEDYVFFAGADCTGHGVPGALMSVICHNLLENAINQNITETNEILFELNVQLIKKLKQGADAKEHIKDGLDIALCRLSKNDIGQPVRVIQYSGAHSPIYIIHEKEISVINPDRIHLGMPIENKELISKNIIEIHANSELILFSDGFPDQKGGTKKKKFFYQPFRELLLETSQLPNDKKKEYLVQKFNNWKGNLKQADDVFVWSLKI